MTNLTKIIIRSALLAVVTGMGHLACEARAEPDHPAVTIESLLGEMIDRDAIARWPAPTYSCKQASSYDRTQTGPDNPQTWFNNQDYDQFIRIEEKAGRKEYVIMDDTGPGCITRWWIPLLMERSASINQMVRIYLDGNDKPAIEVNYYQLISGRAFVKPPFAFISSDEKDAPSQIGLPQGSKQQMGADLYLPIPYAKGCKITLEQVPFFYVINYRKYEQGTDVKSYTMADYEAAAASLKHAAETLDNLKNVADGKERRKEGTIEPGAELAIDLPAGANAVRSLEVQINPQDAPQVLRAAVLEVAFDGETAVWCPLGEFSGCGARLNPVQDWSRSVEKTGKLTSRWVMPYRKTARVALKNHGKKSIQVKVVVSASPWQWNDHSMRFHANWRLQYPINTRPMSDWNYIHIEGQGVYAGDTLTVFNPVPGWYGEGDERIYIDGEKVPSHMGTGTEDYYGYAWGMAHQFNSPFISMPLRDGKGKADWSGYTTTSRLRLLDGIPFRSSLKMDMEVWHSADTKVGYAAGTFWYARPGATSNRGAAAEEASFSLPPWPPAQPAHHQATSAVTNGNLSAPVSAVAAGAGVEFKKLPTEAWSAIIPAQKSLPPDWVKSLTQRGKPREYTGDALMKIGMPVGGICAGLVYLGGDGKLWWWDIFNRKLNGVQPRQIQYKGRSWHGLPPGLGAWQGGNYIEPVMTQPSPFQQGFALRLTVGGKTQLRKLDRTGWKSVTFSGSYPVGTVTYADPDCPVRVKLEVYSPFIPLDFDNSSYPATIMSYQLENTGSEAVKAEVVGWLENAVLIDSGKSLQGIVRTNQITTQQGSAMLACAASRPPAVEAGRTHRPDIVFDAFEKDTYEGWTVEGSAFGKGPIAKKDVPIYQGDLGMHGSRAVNSHASALVNVSGSDQAMSIARDDAKGSLTSKSFKVERDYISFLIGGGNKPECALRLVADGKVLKSVSGHDANKLSPELLDVREFAGRTVHLEIIDQAAGGWGNIGVDDIVFTDKTPGNSAGNAAEMTQLPDWGTLALATMGSNKSSGSARLADLKDPAVVGGAPAADSPMDKPLIGGVTQSLTLAPGASGTAKFVIAWHFANQPVKGVKGSETGWYYGKRFKDAASVATHIAAHEPELSAATLRWRETWFDSTLPYWFLDRSFISLDCLASTTCYRFADGRFYTYEGVRSCDGHPNHVWHYAQGHARLFPELEQDVLERVWYGFGFHADGSLAYRGEVAGDSAIDGHCGVILSVLRNFQTSPDGAALKRIWPQVKKSIEYAMACDRDGNGLLDTPKLTTLDEPWHGEIPWISSLYIAALKAGEVMATEMGDAVFAGDCRDRAAKGRAAMDTRLFNGEWFIQKPDPANLTKLGAYETVHIDQVLGQAWAWQVGLGRVLNEATTRSALRSIWKYNFARNLDNYDAKADPKGRPYYGDGEGGLVMTANALGRKTPFGVYSGFACYLNETMNGFEYQAAAHMIAEGMVQEGLAVMKTLDERYDGNKRNPFDEVECGDHYARSMASYGALIAISGFTYNGPHGAIGFAPRLTPENFKAPFTAAEGWGSYSQKSEVGGQRSEIRVKWGSLRLRTISLATPAKPGSATVKVGNKPTASSLSWQDGKATLTLTNEVVLTAGQALEINLTK